MEPIGHGDKSVSKIAEDWQLLTDKSFTEKEADQLLKILKSLDSLPSGQVTYNENERIFVSKPTGVFASISRAYWGGQDAQFDKGLDDLTVKVGRFYKMLERLIPEEIALISPEINEIQSLFQKTMGRFKDQEGHAKLLSVKIDEVSKNINTLIGNLMENEKFKASLRAPTKDLPGVPEGKKELTKEEMGALFIEGLKKKEPGK